jgi:hypothetical protein
LWRASAANARAERYIGGPARPVPFVFRTRGREACVCVCVGEVRCESCVRDDGRRRLSATTQRCTHTHITRAAPTHQHEQHDERKRGLCELDEQVDADGVEVELALLVLRQVHEHGLQACVGVRGGTQRVARVCFFLLLAKRARGRARACVRARGCGVLALALSAADACARART